MSVAGEFLEQVRADKGAQYATVVEAWADLLNTFDPLDTSNEGRQRAVAAKIQSVLSVNGFHGVMPEGADAAAKELLRLRREGGLTDLPNVVDETPGAGE